MRCPRCLAENESKVLSTRHHGDFETRRRRECIVCGCRFSTVEVAVVPRISQPLNRSGSCISDHVRCWYLDRQ